MAKNELAATTHNEVAEIAIIFKNSMMLYKTVYILVIVC